MSQITDLPAWAAIPVCLLLLGGAALTLIGAAGLVRFETFYRRLHTPGLAAIGGTAMICAASALTFLMLEGRWIVHEILIVVFVALTTPVAMVMLAAAALYRDRSERRDDVPAKVVRHGPPDAPTAAEPIDPR
ncbi:monovalent cation/H(+) antiporter subunit G [Ensifer soli]|uniref:monovalent cation/H(+) antiporter subunit G n=1 Tax=Ciceribacter sp. sgz301302 TaxID=3342379 RepID=UPI0035B966C8